MNGMAAKLTNTELEKVIGGYSTRQILVTAYSFANGERYQDSAFFYIVRENTEVLDLSQTVLVWRVPNEDLPADGGKFPLKDSYDAKVPASDLVYANQLR